MKNKKAMAFEIIAKLVFYLVIALVIYIVFSNFVTVSKKTAYRLFDTEIQKYELEAGSKFHPSISPEHKEFYTYNVKNTFMSAVKTEEGKELSECYGVLQVPPEMKEGNKLNGYYLTLSQDGKDIKLSMYEGGNIPAAFEEEPIIKNMELCVLTNTVYGDEALPLNVTSINIRFNKEEGDYVRSAGGDVNAFYYRPYDLGGYDYYLFKIVNKTKDGSEKYFCVVPMKKASNNKDELGSSSAYVSGKMYQFLMSSYSLRYRYSNFCNIPTIKGVAIEKECYYSKCELFNNLERDCNLLNQKCSANCQFNDAWLGTDECKTLDLSS